MSITLPSVFTAIDKLTAPMRKMGASMDKFANKTVSAGAKTQRAFRKVNNAVGSLESKLFNLRNAAGLVAVGAGVTAMYNFATSTAKAGDEAAKTSRLIGISAEQLQEYRFAADRQGVSSETLTKSFQLLNRNIGDVQLGQGALTTVLNKNNPALLKQLKSVKNNSEAFELITDAISKMPNQLQKTALAQAAFGRSGGDMLKLLEVGPEGMAKLIEEARKYGGIISDEAAAKSEEFIDAQTNMNFAIRGVKNMIGVELMPVIQKYIEYIAEWISANKELISTKVESFINKVESAISYLTNNMDKIVSVTKKLITGYIILKGVLLASQVAIIAVQVAMGIYRGAVIAAKYAQLLWNKAVNANPLGVLLLLIIALTAAIVIIIKKWDSWGASITAIITIFAAFFSPIIAGFGLIISLVMSVYKNWGMIKKGFTEGGILGGLKAIGVTLFDVILRPLQQILKVIGSITGMKMAKNAAADLEAFRANLGIETVNPKKTQQDALGSTIEKNINNKTTVDFINLPDGTKITGDGISNSMIPVMNSTFAMQ